MACVTGDSRGDAGEGLTKSCAEKAAPRHFRRVGREGEILEIALRLGPGTVS